MSAQMVVAEVELAVEQLPCSQYSREMIQAKEGEGPHLISIAEMIE